MDGRFVPGEKIDPEVLAAQFGCSRTPIRQALQALENSGLVRIESKRGTFVSKLNVVELTERFEVMAELEGMCARLAARRATTEDIKRLREAQNACEKAIQSGDTDEYYFQNTRFHQLIYAASGNHFLEQEAVRLQTMLQPYRRRQLQLRGRMRRSFDEHGRIVQLISEGLDTEAGAEMHTHVIIQGDRFHELVASLRSENF